MAKTKNQNIFNGFFSQIRLGESYTSLILGAVVVIVGLILVFSLIKGKNAPIQETSSSKTVQTQETKTVTVEKNYVVKPGDDLWHISESLYGTGYNWVDLAQANNLTNPSVIYTGTKLTVPNIAQNQKTVAKADETTTQSTIQQDNKITTNTYKIVHGDDLWDIAIRAYGDGYKWTEIAKANNLVNPNLIHSDNILILPR